MYSNSPYCLFSHPYVTARAPIHTSEGCIPEYLPPSIGDNQSGSILSVHVHAKQDLRAQAAVLKGRIRQNFVCLHQEN